MSQKQVVAHSAKVKRADITRLPTSDGWSWTPANLQADQAVAQESAWRSVWTDDEMKSVAEKIRSLRSGLELSQEWPPEAMQDVSSTMQRTRGCCEFHIVRIFERNRGQLFVDFSEERLKELKADLVLGKVAKDMPFDWLKERVIYLLHSKHSPAWNRTFEPQWKTRVESLIWRLDEASRLCAPVRCVLNNGVGCPRMGATERSAWANTRPAQSSITVREERR